MLFCLLQHDKIAVNSNHQCEAVQPAKHISISGSDIDGNTGPSDNNRLQQALQVLVFPLQNSVEWKTRSKQTI